MAELEILAFFLGNPPASSCMFPVIAHGGTSVGTWRTLVYAKKQHSLRGYDAASLTLWKLNNAISEEEVDKWLAAHSQNLSAVAVEMLPANNLSDYFSVPPPRNKLHVVVVLHESTLKRKRNDSDVLERRKRRRLELLPQSLTVFKTEADPGRPGYPARLPMNGGFRDMTSLYNLIAVDKTKYIELLDEDSKYQHMFLRPQLWGKSTFLQTLMDYYDIFGDLYIGKNPTTDRNSLLVLRFNFSEVSGFLARNQAFLGGPNLELVHDSDGTKSLKQVLGLVERQGERLFVGVDGYDAPVRTVLFDQNGDRYQVVAGFLKSSFFAIIKQAALTVVDKYWITGVLPVFREEPSPLNATMIISDKPRYNGLCGFTDTEVREIAQSYLFPSYEGLRLEGVVEQLKRWYGGYLFFREKGETSAESLYNPRLVLTHLRGLANKQLRLTPLEEINGVYMSSVLTAILDTGNASFGSYLGIISGKIRTRVVHQFGAAEVRKEASIPWTLLYFFGVLTNADDGLHLKVPNMTMTNVITRHFSKFLTKQIHLTPTKSDAAYDGLLRGEIEPLAELLETFFEKEPARAVNGCNEAALRTSLAVFWSEGDCLTELSLLIDPRARPGNGRSGFLDLFLPTPSSASCIQLKNIQLEALWRGPRSDDLPLEALREELRRETEDQLLGRKVFYEGEEKFVKDVKREAFEQINRSLEVMKNGVATTDIPGVHDHRVQQGDGECTLVGYVLILLGGTRALGWRVRTERTNFTFHVKDEVQEHSIIP